MKLFIDTANLADIEEALRGGYICGITTNPSLLAKEPKGNYLEHLRKIITLAKGYGGAASVSVEVFSNEPDAMVAQAKEFMEQLDYPELAVKIPVSYRGRDNLGVIRILAKQEKIRVNCTACMTAMQLALAAAAGARYVSLFYNRLKDAATEARYAAEREKLLTEKSVELDDFDPDKVLRDARLLLAEYPETEIIVGSIRNPLDVRRASLNGGHIVTASLKVLKEALMHFKTDDSVDRFLADFSAWMT